MHERAAIGTTAAQVQHRLRQTLHDATMQISPVDVRLDHSLCVVHTYRAAYGTYRRHSTQ